MPHIENHLPHRINVVPNPYFGYMPEQRWPERPYVPRSAEQTVAVLGMARIAGYEVPVLLRRFTGLVNDEHIPYDADVLKVVSQETIAAARRSGRSIGDLAYPLGILRDQTGRVLGCSGFGMPQPAEPLRAPDLALTPDDVAALGDAREWVSTTNYPLRLYAPDVVPPEDDLVDRSIHAPILDMPVPTAPVDSSPRLEVDESRTEQFNVPVFKVHPNYGPDAIQYLPPPEERDRPHFIHPIALRHAALLGQSLRFCVVAGGLLRDSREGTVVGGSAVYVIDPEMLSRDGI